MNKDILIYLKKLYNISEEEQKRFLEKLKNISKSDKEKILVFLSKEYKKIEKIRKKLILDLKQAYNKAFEEIDYIQDNLYL